MTTREIIDRILEAKDALPDMPLKAEDLLKALVSDLREVKNEKE